MVPPRTTEPVLKLVPPVPPLATARVPLTSDVPRFEAEELAAERSRP